MKEHHLPTVSEAVAAATSIFARKRDLSGSQDEEYESPYFEEYDADGDAYSLAWRYLGVFIDDDGYYSRKVLWAAVSIVSGVLTNNLAISRRFEIPHRPDPFLLFCSTTMRTTPETK